MGTLEVAANAPSATLAKTIKPTTRRRTAQLFMAGSCDDSEKLPTGSVLILTGKPARLYWSAPAPLPRGLFWLFWGAKKGLFLGAHQKSPSSAKGALRKAALRQAFGPKREGGLFLAPPQKTPAAKKLQEAKKNARIIQRLYDSS